MCDISMFEYRIRRQVKAPLRAAQDNFRLMDTFHPTVVKRRLLDYVNSLSDRFPSIVQASETYFSIIHPDLFQPFRTVTRLHITAS